MLVFRRVWHPCHTHAALLLILPRKPQNSQKFLAEKSIPQTHRRRVWHPAIPTQPSCLSSHGSHRTRRSFWRRRASHRCTRMSTDFSSLPITSSFFVLCEDCLVAAWVWQGCHTLLWLALFFDEVEFMSCQYSIFFFVTNSV